MEAEEEEDRILLSSLGIKSAKAEEVERGILTEIEHEGDAKNDVVMSVDASCDDDEGIGSSMASRASIVGQLRAVEVEIKAVVASIERAKVTEPEEGDEEEEGEKRISDGFQLSHSGRELQHALATDRLKSLKRTKARLQKELDKYDKTILSHSSNNEEQLKNLVKEDKKLKKILKEVPRSSNSSKKKLKTVSFNDDLDFDAVLDASSAGFIESERDKLVRKGILTPFHKLKGFERPLQEPSGPSNRLSVQEKESTEDLASASISKAAKSFSDLAQARPTTKLLDAKAVPKLEAPTRPFRRIKAPLIIPQSSHSDISDIKNKKEKKRKRPLPDKVWRRKLSRKNDSKRNVDDVLPSDNDEDSEDIDSEAVSDELAYVTLEGGLKVPDSIFQKLFDYQKVGLQWLWELHCQKAGGIIGDEMGLGKTIQVLSFLGSLHFSKMYKPSIIICPMTLLQQWKREAQKWYPGFHVEILHDSAQSSLNGRKQAHMSATDSNSEDSMDSDREQRPSGRSSRRWDVLIERILRSESGLLITTYEQLRLLSAKLLDVEWGYAVLDEGHRIRNPNAEVTLVCKQLQTVHRIIMTGAPIQNKLSELWSLFDFVFPGKLGVLPVFESEFAVPISVGGYANASPLQVSTAYRCAVVLRDLIMPYLLRRMKVDVNAQLPKKTEHVLFCKLTSEQIAAYRAFLASSEVEQIFDGSRNSLYGIDVMRKICNHPDLLEREHAANDPDYGNVERSGKMKVVEQVLKLWKQQGHRVLLFAQTQQMLDIIENFLIKVEYTYRRMDGLTPAKQRMSLMDEFNDSTEIFTFILTTRVGGLGTNLTGANRVIVFDPDWNPSTDIQARERAWRIGQMRDVTVYRLITRGTIEEKVYHRQIYKHFLTNKILKNPQQKRFFKARDMKDLFTLKEDGDDGTTETSNIFSQISGDAELDIKDCLTDKQKVSVGLNADDAVLDDTSSELGNVTSKGKEKTDESPAEDEETRVLKSLFGGQGLHSAMNHDIIINANDGEKVKIEEEAFKVAQRAAEALRHSRMLRNHDNVSIPTWTGKAGTAGAPSSVRRKFGSTVNTQLIGNSNSPLGSPGSSKVVSNSLSVGASSGKALTSAELLTRIRTTQEGAAADGFEHQFQLSVNSRSSAHASMSRSSAMLPPKFVQPEILIRQLCTFIQIQGGSSSSAFIVQHFKDRIPSKGGPLFKNLLKELATLEKDSNGSSKWVLKPEYRDGTSGN